MKRLHQFGSEDLRGIFVGYAQQSGEGWNKDLYIVDVEELANATNAHEVHIKQFKAAEVHIIYDKGNYRFPVATKEVTQPELDTKSQRPPTITKKVTNDLERIESEQSFKDDIRIVGCA